MDRPADLAAARFSEGFNCAQAVFSAFAARLGLEEKTALRIAAPFGGGMARRGEVCGAASGALLALGLGRCQATPEGKEDAYQLGGEFLSRFEQQHGSLLCRDLLGCDISTPAGRQQARETGVFSAVCPALVREAARLAGSLLEEK